MTFAFGGTDEEDATTTKKTPSKPFERSPPEAFILRKFDFPAVRAKVTSVERGRAKPFSRADGGAFVKRRLTFFDADASRPTLAVEGSASMPVGAFVRTPGVFKLRRFDFVKAEGVRGGGMRTTRLGARSGAAAASRCAGSSSTRSRLLLRSPFFKTELYGEDPSYRYRTRSSSIAVARSTTASLNLRPEPRSPRRAAWTSRSSASARGRRSLLPEGAGGVGGEHRGRHARGMVYGAVRGYRAHDPQYAEVAAIVAKRHRWMSATSEATLGGLRLGSFVAVFSAVQLASASHRADGARDMWDTVAAGAVTAGATGLALPGGLGVRMKGSDSACSSGAVCASRWGTSRRSWTG